jgi:putrescine aminotransferase
MDYEKAYIKNKKGENSKHTIKQLIEKYRKYVSSPKVDFYKKLDIDVIQGKANGVFIEIKKENGTTVKLIDCRTSGGVFNLGHGHPDIKIALQEAIDLGLDIGDHHLLSEYRALLAEKLAKMLPGDITKTQYCATGGEAMDLAIKLARGYTKRKKIISATIGYHGVTGLSLAAGHSKFKDIFLWNPDDFVQITFGNIQALEKVIKDDVAAIVIETIPATGGILIATEGYFQLIRELCDKHGVMLISDEVQTGLGRTGKLWGIHGGLYKDEKVVPDIIVLAKGMSAGIYPLATCSYRPFIEEVFEFDPFLHISTTGGSEIGCYITSKMLDIINEPSFLENVNQRGEQLRSGLQQIINEFNLLLDPFFNYSLIEDLRGRGLMWGIEFADKKFSILFTKFMIQNGIFADFCGNQEQTVKLMPPLIVTEEIIDEILRRLKMAFQSLVKYLKEA